MVDVQFDFNGFNEAPAKRGGIPAQRLDVRNSINRLQ